MKKGVLIMAYGSPNNEQEVEPYYTDIRRGRKPSQEALEELIDRYKMMGFPSPLLRLTNSQASKLQELLGEEYKVYVGMRHWTPWIADAVAEMKADGITHAVGLVMAPHFSSMSIEKYIENVEKGKKKHDANIEFKYIKNWHLHQMYLQPLQQRIYDALEKFNHVEKDKVHVIFTAHSLPERILENNDPYPRQLMETSKELASRCGFANWHFAYQSAGRTQERWLGPDLLEVISELNTKGVKHILVCSVGFIIDHLEVIYDIDIEAKDLAKELGIQLERAESLNDDPMLIKAFEDLVRKTL